MFDKTMYNIDHKIIATKKEMIFFGGGGAKKVLFLEKKNECCQAKRDLRDVEFLRQNCGLFDVIEIAVPRKKYSGVPQYFLEFNNA